MSTLRIAVSFAIGLWWLASTTLPLGASPVVTVPGAIVTVAPSFERIRFTASRDVVRMRVNFVKDSGAVVFDSGWRVGRAVDVFRATERYPAGRYQSVVTVADAAGRLTTRRAALSVQIDRILVESRRGDRVEVSLPEQFAPPMTWHQGAQSTVAPLQVDPPETVVMPDGVVVTTTVSMGAVTRTASRAGGSPEAAAPTTPAVVDLAIGLGGAAPRTVGVDRNPTAASAGNSLTVAAGGATTGGTNLNGGDLVLEGGVGTGLGAGGDVRVQTAPASGVSGTADNTYADRIIVVARGKQLTLSAPGFASLMSIILSGTATAGGRISYMVRATDGGSQIATEQGVLQYLATANSITCTVQTTDKLHLGTVNSGCTPGFFNPGSHPGVSVFDNVSFSSPAPIVLHEVYFTIENQSGSAIRLEP